MDHEHEDYEEVYDYQPRNPPTASDVMTGLVFIVAVILTVWALVS